MTTNTIYVRKCDECGHKQKSTEPPATGGEARYDNWANMLCKKCKSAGLDYGGYGTYKEINGKLEKTTAPAKADSQKTYAGVTVGDMVIFVVHGTELREGVLANIYYPEGTVRTESGQLYTIDLNTIYPATTAVVYAVKNKVAVTNHAQLAVEKAKKDVERSIAEYIAAAHDAKKI